LAILRNIAIESKDENHLWQLLLQGDKTALTEVMDSYMNALYNYGIRFSVDRNIVEDCIQNLFVGIWQRKDFLNTPVNLKSYLFSSLRRMVLRKAKLLKNVPVVSIDENDSFGFDFDFSIEHTMIQQEESRITAKKINDLMATLTKRQKEIIYLKFFENLNREEIADILEISFQSVSNLLQKALKNMRSFNDIFRMP
jgi:RNA polymerase sigma factor (sigma-70 family)